MLKKAVVWKVLLKRELWKSLKISHILITIKVIGVPIILNGDLKNQFVHSDIGFDTICKVIGAPITLNGDLKNQFVGSDVGFDNICKKKKTGAASVYMEEIQKDVNEIMTA